MIQLKKTFSDCEFGELKTSLIKGIVVMNIINNLAILTILLTKFSSQERNSIRTVRQTNENLRKRTKAGGTKLQNKI